MADALSLGPSVTLRCSWRVINHKPYCIDSSNYTPELSFNVLQYKIQHSFPAPGLLTARYSGFTHAKTIMIVMGEAAVPAAGEKKHRPEKNETGEVVLLLLLMLLSLVLSGAAVVEEMVAVRLTNTLISSCFITESR